MGTIGCADGVLHGVRLSDDDSVDVVDCNVTRRGVDSLLLSSDALLLLLLLCKSIYLRLISSNRVRLLTSVISLGADMVVMVSDFVACVVSVLASYV